MAINRTDLWFTGEGDFQVDVNGDIKDTSAQFGRALIQEIRTRLRAQQGDWPLNKSIGANLESQLGEAATSKTIESISRAIIHALTFDRLLSPASIEVIPFPLGKGLVFFRLIIQTAEGELTETLGYDSDEARFMGY